ncbi:MAG: hypothetical protein AB8B74_07610 [Crocinitomicaceae bacterium]
MKIKFLIAFFLGLLLSCSTTKSSIIIADTYDEEKDMTTLIIAPLGNINIPGKWTKTKYNEVSRQHFFKNNNETTIAIAKNLKEKYPFYSKSASNIMFAKIFFEWEKAHYEQQGFTVGEYSKGSNYIIWTAKKDEVNTMFLYGAKGNFAYNYSVFANNWSEEKRVQFLKDLLEKNE